MSLRHIFDDMLSELAQSIEVLTFHESKLCGRVSLQADGPRYIDGIPSHGQSLPFLTDDKVTICSLQKPQTRGKTRCI